MHDFSEADLDPQTEGILQFAAKLTRTPAEMKEEDAMHLRKLGLTDEQILSTVGITCVFNFMNRLAEGLGVDIPEERRKVMANWVTGPAKEQDWLGLG